MIALTLSELATVMEGQATAADSAGDSVANSAADKTFDGEVCVDSRLATAGSIFFAQRGETTDGHRYIADAIAGGAVLVVAEHPSEGITVPQIIVADAVTALAALARFVVAAVRERGTLRVVGITGSNGKTTTKNMMRTILEGVGPTVAPRASFNNHVGAPLSMLEIDYDTRFLIVEMGASAEGEIASLVQIVMPDVAVVLKVGLAHAGVFGGIEATQRAKAEIVTGLPSSAVAILNTDDDRVESMAALTAAKVVRFGLSERADLRAVDVSTSIEGTRFLVVTGAGPHEESHEVRLQLIGEHQVMNALAAFAAARELGVEVPHIIDALGSMERAERWRMELQHTASGVTILNDAYNASPDSMAAALKTLAQVVGGHRSIAVLGEMSELGEFSDEEHDRIGRLVVRLNIAQLIVVGHGARHIHNAAGLEGSWDGESVLVDTAEEAYALLSAKLQPGDIVLVKSSNSAGLRLLGDRLSNDRADTDASSSVGEGAI